MADPDIAKAEVFWEAVKTFARLQAAKRLAALRAAACDLENSGLSPEPTPRSEGIATSSEWSLYAS